MFRRRHVGISHRRVSESRDRAEGIVPINVGGDQAVRADRDSIAAPVCGTTCDRSRAGSELRSSIDHAACRWNALARVGTPSHR